MVDTCLDDATRKKLFAQAVDINTNAPIGGIVQNKMPISDEDIQLELHKLNMLAMSLDEYADNLQDAIKLSREKESNNAKRK